MKFLLEHAAAALFLDPGLRKTSASLAAFSFLQKRKLARKALVIAPLRPCYQVWPEEVAKWTDFCHLRVVVLHGPKKDQALREDADLYVINPAGLEWLAGGDYKKADLRRWKALGFDTLIVDELTMFKNPGTKRFKLMKKLAPTFARRWGLTGSPSAESLMDLFGQVYVLDLGRSFGPYVTHFRSKYFRPVDQLGYVWILQEGGEEAIYERLRPLALRLDAKDHLDLPPLLENEIRFDLPAPVVPLYRDLEEELIAELQGKVIVAANVAVAMNKCRQVTGGALYVPESNDDLVLGRGGLSLSKTASQRKKEWEEVHTAKLDALEELRDELQGKPLLVAYEFQHELERLTKRFPHAEVLGKKPAEVAALARRWNAGQVPLLLAQPQSAAHGLNLQGAGEHVVWFTLTWSYELYDQFIRRVYRSGTKAKRVMVHTLLARRTIDEHVRRVLLNKAKGQQALFTALKNTYIRKG